MQCAIDNAKRTFDIDLNKEIKIIKDDMDISHREKDEYTNKMHTVADNGYPSFFSSIKKRNEIKTMNISGDSLKTLSKKYSKKYENNLFHELYLLQVLQFLFLIIEESLII